MKIIFKGILLFMILQSCSKSNSDSSSINIQNISGNYKGGTLTWTKVNGSTVTNGTDPNFSFSITYLGSDKARLAISTIAPINTKQLDLQLYSKQEDNTSGSYTFNVINSIQGGVVGTTLNVIIYSSLLSPAATFASVYTTEQFDGSGTKY
ncbi:MAG: hypothetical protein JWN83_2586 [Chitinophagaceae bacterium]|nr:hypothetical protein [Chitinophagaceae bacterium]